MSPQESVGLWRGQVEYLPPTSSGRQQTTVFLPEMLKWLLRESWLESKQWCFQDLGTAWTRLPCCITHYRSTYLYYKKDLQVYQHALCSIALKIAKICNILVRLRLNSLLVVAHVSPKVCWATGSTGSSAASHFFRSPFEGGRFSPSDCFSWGAGLGSAGAGEDSTTSSTGLWAFRFWLSLRRICFFSLCYMKSIKEHYHFESGCFTK